MRSMAVPQMVWYGDTELEISFPDSWDVTVCNMNGYAAAPLDDRGMQLAFDNPIGSAPIRELARGKDQVAILFDDCSRGTPVSAIVPYVLAELAHAGIEDNHIRFIAATGAHAAMSRYECALKLGADILGRFLVYNHNPYENCTTLGMTSGGTRLAINSEVARCDLKIGIGAIYPHISAGFGGGSKIIVPGVASMDTIDANHSRYRGSGTRMGNCIGNTMKLDMDESARMAGLDVKIDAVMNLKREIAALFVGDPVAEHAAGVELARHHYATKRVSDCDAVVANCYSKAVEMQMAIPVATPLLKPDGGELVLMCVTPMGQIVHYFIRSFGTDFGGRRWARPRALPAHVTNLTIMQPYPDRVGADWAAPYDMIHWARSWQEALEGLEKRLGRKAKVAVIPDATVQYFPDDLRD